MGEKNAGTHQAQKRRNYLSHRKCPFPPWLGQNDMPRYKVKRIPASKRKTSLTDDLVQQISQQSRSTLASRL
jgi:hypothetical protein